MVDDIGGRGAPVPSVSFSQEPGAQLSVHAVDEEVESARVCASAKALKLRPFGRDKANRSVALSRALLTAGQLICRR